jgi:hypothetical protein
MSARVGFVILSHEGARKLARLVAAVRREYPDCPIAVHHDFSQVRLDRDAIGSDILWVEDWRRTGWAKWAVVQGALSAFQLLFAKTDAEWFILLSASDYPIRKGSEVMAELEAAKCDAFVDLRPLTAEASPGAKLVGTTSPQLSQFDSPGTLALKRRFYLSQQFWLPILRTRPRLRLGKLTWRPPIAGRHPFRDGLSCFYGDHWFIANRKAIAAILDRNPANLRLRRHYRNRTQPDESYYQTVLVNTPGLVICRDNRRFTEWNGGGAHPMFLTPAQLPGMLESGAFFARKFEEGSPVLDDIDAMLSGASPSSAGTGSRIRRRKRGRPEAS